MSKPSRVRLVPVVYTPAGGVSKTRQEASRDADINTIVNRFLKTGQLPVDQVRVPLSQPGSVVDAAHLPSFVDILNLQARATSLFSQLPRKLQLELGGDYRNLESWIKENPDRAVKMGVAKSVTSVKPVSPPAPQVPAGGAPPPPSAGGGTPPPAAPVAQ